MTWYVEEQKAKIYRIIELEKEGFNTPRFFFLEENTTDGRVDQCLVWANDINKVDPDQIFNIRTYDYGNRKESCQTKHYTDLTLEDLQKILPRANFQFNCIVDAETPDNGRLAGTIVAWDDGRNIIKAMTIEWCEKEVRAMVRDANKSFTGTQKGFLKEIGCSPVIQEVIEKASRFSKKNVILEWTWFCKPTGIRRENLVWWEYRKA